MRAPGLIFDIMEGAIEIKAMYYVPRFMVMVAVGADGKEVVFLHGEWFTRERYETILNKGQEGGCPPQRATSSMQGRLKSIYLAST